MALGLKLDGLLGGVTDLVDDILGNGLGDVVGDVAPAGLVRDLGKTLDGALSGDPTALLGDLLDNGVIDLDLLQGVLGSGGAPNLGSLDELLANVDEDALQDTLDEVFDNGPLGLSDTILDLEALNDLEAVDAESTSTFVTSLVGTILKVAGDAADVDLVLDSLLAGDDSLKGDDDDNRLDGRAGDDTISGLGGDDTLLGGDEEDRISGGDGGDRLYGQAGSDTLSGGDGVDRLYGGEGEDQMAGGDGNDRYVVDNADDKVIEAAGGGRDSVRSSVDYQLTANVERLTLLGESDIDGVGNALNNRVYGNDGDNRLEGGAGDDMIEGRKGVDTLVGGDGEDVFSFRDPNDSGVGGGKRDIVLDYSDDDKFSFKQLDGDLDAPNDQTFDFIGKAGFSGDGFGEIGVTKGSGITLLRVDADGDGSVDMQIELDGAHSFTRGDFIL